MVKRFAFSMIELVFAIVVVAVTVLSLPLMTDVTSTSSADTMKEEEAIFEAYVKALEVTDGVYGALSNETDTTLTTGSGYAQGLKYPFKVDVTVTRGSGFGDRDAGDQNISLVSVSVKDSGEVVAKLYAYDFNVTR